MKNTRTFLGGMALGQLLIMNHVYENELLKQELRDQIQALKRIRDYNSDQLLDFRPKDHIAQQRALGSQGVTSLERLEVHYRYLNFQLLNAFKESLMNASMRPTILLDYYKGMKIQK